MAAMKTIVELFGIRINPLLAHKKLTLPLDKIKDVIFELKCLKVVALIIQNKSAVAIMGSKRNWLNFVKELAAPPN